MSETTPGKNINRPSPKEREIDAVLGDIEKNQQKFAIAAKEFHSLQSAETSEDVGRKEELQVQLVGLEQLILNAMQHVRGRGWDKSFRGEYLYE